MGNKKKKGLLFVVLIAVLLFNFAYLSNSQREGSSSIESNKDAKNEFISNLNLQDKKIASEIYSLIEKGVADWTKKYYSEAESVEQSLKEIGISSELIAKSDVIDTIASLDAGKGASPIEVAIYNAFLILKKVNINKSEFDSKYQLINALRKTWPNEKFNHYFRFNSENRLAKINDLPDLPEQDPKYAFLGNMSAYSSDEYYELFKIKAMDLPSGAIAALFHLMNVKLSSSDRRDLSGNDPRMLIRRYGERACNVAIDYLINPEKYGADSSQSRQLEFASKCPRETREKVFEAALRSGWNEAELYLNTEDEWVNRIMKKYDNSPYGKPKAFPERRLPNAEGLRVVDEKFRLFKEKFNNARTGDKYKDRSLIWDLQREFEPEDRRQKRAFGHMIEEFQYNELYG